MVIAVSIFTVTGLSSAITFFVAAVAPTAIDAPASVPTVEPARRPVIVVVVFATELLQPTMMYLPDKVVVTAELPTDVVELIT